MYRRVLPLLLTAVLLRVSAGQAHKGSGSSQGKADVGRGS